jgi:hypothetical protein
VCDEEQRALECGEVYISQTVRKHCCSWDLMSTDFGNKEDILYRGDGRNILSSSSPDGPARRRSTHHDNVTLLLLQPGYLQYIIITQVMY